MASVRATVRVPLDPETAFKVFTEEIDEWYVKGLATLGPDARVDRKATLRFEPGAGGRLVAVRGEHVLEQAQVTVWEPGVRLVFVDKKQTEVEVQFSAVEGGTKVVLEHRGLDRLAPDAAASTAKHGWRRLAEWFEFYVRERDR
jgi:hypothetical protein